MKGKRKALFIAANYWNTPYRVGSHELASLFAKNGWEVSFMSDPVSPLHLFKIDNNQIRERFKIWLSGGQYDKTTNVRSYVPLTLFPPQKYPILKTRFVFENWHKFTIPNVYYKLKRIGFDNVDLLYFDNATQGIWLSLINYRKSVFRIADNYSGYDKYAGYSRIMEENLVKDVDLVLYTARNFEDYVQSIRDRKSIYFPNGVNFESFANGTKEEPEDLKQIPHPRIIYVGEMEIRFDFGIIKYAAQALPEFSFILIGNEIKAKKEFQNLPNVYVLGIKKSMELSGYLYNSDAGIIPFNVKDYGNLINFVNPIKLHQYFACGLPVISARWDELEKMGTEAFLYDTYDEFVLLLKRATESEADRNKLIEYAKLNDWEIRYEQLIRELGF
jgi:hypothetical protein